MWCIQDTCQTCQGLRWSYNATAKTRYCDGVQFTLIDELECRKESYYLNGINDGDYNVGETYDCWVSDCEYAEFTLEDYGTKIKTSIALYIAGGVLLPKVLWYFWLSWDICVNLAWSSVNIDVHISVE